MWITTQKNQENCKKNDSSALFSTPVAKKCLNSRKFINILIYCHILISIRHLTAQLEGTLNAQDATVMQHTLFELKIVDSLLLCD